jgi:uncharacterized protein with FMN-binding domain
MRRVIPTVVGTVIALVLLLSFKTHTLTTTSAAAVPPAAVSTPSTAASATPSAATPSDPASSASASSDSASASDDGDTLFGEPSDEPSSAAPTTAAPTTKTTTPAPKKTTSTAAKTVQGDAADTRYGPVQVQITVTGGKITAATVVQVPANDPRDVEINNYAVPILNQEAIQAGTAQINMVSGATYTSVGYAQSLQSALDKAKSS